MPLPGKVWTFLQKCSPDEVGSLVKEHSVSLNNTKKQKTGLVKLFRCTYKNRYQCRYEVKVHYYHVSNEVHALCHGRHDHTIQARPYFLPQAVNVKVQYYVQSGAEPWHLRKLLEEEGLPPITDAQLTCVIRRVKQQLGLVGNPSASGNPADLKAIASTSESRKGPMRSQPTDPSFSADHHNLVSQLQLYPNYLSSSSGVPRPKLPRFQYSHTPLRPDLTGNLSSLSPSCPSTSSFYPLPSFSCSPGPSTAAILSPVTSQMADQMTIMPESRPVITLEDAGDHPPTANIDPLFGGLIDPPPSDQSSSYVCDNLQHRQQPSSTCGQVRFAKPAHITVVTTTSTNFGQVDSFSRLSGSISGDVSGLDVSPPDIVINQMLSRPTSSHAFCSSEQVPLATDMLTPLPNPDVSLAIGDPMNDSMNRAVIENHAISTSRNRFVDSSRPRSTARQKRSIQPNSRSSICGSNESHLHSRHQQLPAGIKRIPMSRKRTVSKSKYRESVQRANQLHQKLNNSVETDQFPITGVIPSITERFHFDTSANLGGSANPQRVLNSPIPESVNASVGAPANGCQSCGFSMDRLEQMFSNWFGLLLNRFEDHDQNLAKLLHLVGENPAPDGSATNGAQFDTETNAQFNSSGQVTPAAGTIGNDSWLNEDVVQSWDDRGSTIHGEHYLESIDDTGTLEIKADAGEDIEVNASIRGYTAVISNENEWARQDNTDESMMESVDLSGLSHTRQNDDSSSNNNYYGTDSSELTGNVKHEVELAGFEEELLDVGERVPAENNALDAEDGNGASPQFPILSGLSVQRSTSQSCLEIENPVVVPANLLNTGKNEASPIMSLSRDSEQSDHLEKTLALAPSSSSNLIFSKNEDCLGTELAPDPDADGRESTDAKINIAGTDDCLVVYDQPGSFWHRSTLK